ncbi:MAG TPA: hypothetical protein VGT79_10875 [Xanthomonadaceae bacterium]|nr:hypothetical protein [Xanthomonadaceae bacterium]
MGLALILILIMLTVLLAPLLYLLLSIAIIRQANRARNRLVAVAIAIVISAAYPAFQVGKVMALQQKCSAFNSANEGAVTLDPQPILLVDEVNLAGMGRGMDYQSMHINQTYIYTAGMVRGKLTPINECRNSREPCPLSGIDAINYYVYTTDPHPVEGAGLFDPMVAKVQLVDNRTGKVLRERQDYALGGFLGAFHGVLYGHPGTLSCGYASATITAWRPKGGLGRLSKYMDADSRFLFSAFPWLKR